MMPDHILTTYVIWAVMFVVWMLGRMGNKRTKKGKASWGYALLYLSYIFLFLPPLLGWGEGAPAGKFWILGLALCFVGATLATWARIALGRNWSGAAKEKEGHELITSGPYALVRHPIYLGLALAILGSALAIGTPVAAAAAILGGASIFLRIRTEERLMAEIFPGRYMEYSARVRKFIPFVW